MAHSLFIGAAVTVFIQSLNAELSEDNWSTIRSESENAILIRISDIEGIDVFDGDSYRLDLLLPNVNLYYTKNGQKITINNDITATNKLSIEADLDDDLGPLSLVEAVAIVKHLTSSLDIIDGSSSQSSEVDIVDILDSDVSLDLEDAVEIETETRFYYAPETLDPEEVQRLATPVDNTTVESSDALTTLPVPIDPELPTRPTRIIHPLRPTPDRPDRYPRDTRIKRKMKPSGWGTSVNYKISSKFSSDEKAKIELALDHWESETCIRFTKKSGWLFFKGLNFRKKNTNKYCGSSPVGKKWYGNRIKLVTSSYCFVLGVIAHEIGHSLGFRHEHARPDRDDYVTINWGSISRSKKRNYHKKCWGNTYTYGVPYDYSSVMHYQDSNKITLKDETMEYITGQRVGLSFRDAKLANYHYCKGTCSSYSSLEWSRCEHGGYRDPNSCSRCKCPTGWKGIYCQTKDNDAICGTSSLVATTTMQNLNSPSSSGQVDCAWLITAPTSNKVFVRFTGAFSMSGTSRSVCTADYVEIRWKNKDQIGARRCGYSRPADTYESATNEIMVVFHSDNLRSSDTFNIEYWTGSCGLCASNYAPQKTCNTKHTDTCYISYTTRCGWWKRCTRTRSHSCYKLTPYCCHGRVSGDECDVGCGGCTDSYIANQPSCAEKQYRKQYYAYYTSCGWFRRCRRTGTRSVYSHTTYRCCGNYQLSSDQTRCIKP